jgi:methylenetetrahydrofolate dehydrogenase (NADP+)/methenyltetrahydrofolate cyclohydrolase
MKKTDVVVMDGEAVASKIYDKIREDYTNAKEAGHLKRAPKLVILLIGENPASLIYVNRKIKACQELGFDCQLDQRIDKENYNAEKIVEIVGKYNSDKKVDGIIVQMPLPEGIEPNKVLEAIDPQKDVDGLSPVSYGKIALGLDFEYFQPCTANGVVKMLEYYKLPIAGKRIVVVGAGIVAGKAIALMLMNRKATVTVCNSKTTDLGEVTKLADILVVATGKTRMITAEMVKPGAVVVDVGISRNKDGEISGDVDFLAVKAKASFISPVPGGIGKLTVACLMENLLKAALD